MSGFGESGRVASLDALRGGAAFAVAIAHYLAYGGIGPFRAEAASPRGRATPPPTRATPSRKTLPSRKPTTRRKAS